MLVGHVNLSRTFNGAGEHFVSLIEALQKRGVAQYVLVRNTALAKRLDLVENVTVGPLVRSAVTAYCLLPRVDVLHIHDRAARPTGLLMKLTRSIPYVMNKAVSIDKDNSPISKATQHRASGFIAENQIDADEHLHLYEQAVEEIRARPVLL